MPSATVVAHVEAIFRYPVKSMRGEQLEAADVGLHGIQGDRRFALHKLNDASAFPWLNASKLAELILFSPRFNTNESNANLPTHVATPDGRELEILSEELAAELTRRHNAPVKMMQLKQGIFDAASISVISTATVNDIGRLAAMDLDIRRFRPNVVVRLKEDIAFQEDGWVGGTLTFGESADGPSIAVTERDERCSMIGLDPDSAAASPEILKTVVRANQGTAGVYAAVIRAGRIEVGQTISIAPF